MMHQSQPSLLSMGLAFLTTYILCKMGEGRFLLAYPNHRSAHSQPTSIFGGIAMFVGVATALFVQFLFFPPSEQPINTLKIFGCVSLLWLFGLIDDVYPLSAKIRLLFQLIFAIVVILTLNTLISLPGPLGFLNIPFTLLFIMGFINASNFSDGINGLWSGTVLVCSLFMAYINPHDVMIPIFLGSVIAYFILNFPKGRIFMGDSGSTFLGGVILCQGLFNLSYGGTLPITHYPSIIMAFSPLAFVFADVFVTLSKRIIQGHHPFEAHKDHYFQKLVHILKLSHGTTTLIYIAGSLLSALLLVRFALKDIWGLLGYGVLQIFYFIMIEWLCVKKSEKPKPNS